MSLAGDVFIRDNFSSFLSRSFPQKLMKKCLALILVTFASCSLFEDTKLVDIQKLDGPCIITLIDGSIIETTKGIEVTKRYEGITYRDEDGKIWSLFKEEYESYSCGN